MSANLLVVDIRRVAREERADFAAFLATLSPQQWQAPMLEEVAGLFGGLEMVEPGVAQFPRWRPDRDATAPGPLSMWCGVARKTTTRF